jgi:hypothetical protein
MFRIYAFDPQAIRNPTLRSSLEQFGFEHGRVIAALPKAWLKEVIECVRNEFPGNKRIELLIERLNRKNVVRRISLADLGDSDWLTRELECSPSDVQGILVAKAGECGDSRIIEEDDIHDENGIWKPSDQGRVDRDPMAIASVVCNLTRFSSTIKFIDPHFSGEPRHTDVVLRCIETRSKLAKKDAEGFEIHFRYPSRNLVSS